MPEYPIRVSVQLEKSVYDALTQVADENDRPLAWVIRHAIREYLEQHPRPKS